MSKIKQLSFTTKKFAKDFFSTGHSRTLEAKKNIVASFLIKGLSICISIVLVPLTINYVNPIQYGIWLTLSSIIAWFSFFDIGFGNGLRNRFAEAKATGDFEKASIYVSTTYAVLTLIFTTVWLLFLGANYFLDWSKILNAPSEMTSELSTLAIIVFTFFCLQIVLKTINTILIADQKPAKSAFFDLLGQLIAIIVIFILTKTQKSSLIYLGFALGFIPVIVLIVSSFWFYRNSYKKFAPTLSKVNFNDAKNILSLGSKFFIIQIAVIVIYQTSNIIIAQVGTPKDVTIFNIAYKYFGIATMIFAIIITPFWSAFTDALAKHDFLWMKRSYKNLRVIALSLIVLTLIMIPLANLGYKLWIGDAVSVRISISIIVAFYIITNIWNSLHSLLLNGMGKIKLQYLVSIIGTFLNIPLAIFFGRKFGIEGVVFSSLLLNLISAVYSPIQVTRILNKKAKGIWNE